MSRWTPSRDRDDRGMITAFVVAISLGMIFVAGMVYDGGQRITTYMRASDLAGNAARAAAQAADPATLYDPDVDTRLDPAEAERAARDFLAEAGYPTALSSFEVTGAGNQVTVVVELDQTAIVLDWLGTTKISASATSTAIRGVDAP